jgi:hypothetical protein
MIADISRKNKNHLPIQLPARSSAAIIRNIYVATANIDRITITSELYKGGPPISLEVESHFCIE